MNDARRFVTLTDLDTGAQMNVPVRESTPDAPRPLMDHGDTMTGVDEAFKAMAVPARSTKPATTFKREQLIDVCVLNSSAEVRRSAAELLYDLGRRDEAAEDVERIAAELLERAS